MDMSVCVCHEQVLRHQDVVLRGAAVRVRLPGERAEQDRPLHANGLGDDASRRLRLGRV